MYMKANQRQLNQHIYPDKEYMQQIKLSKSNKQLKGRYKMFNRRGNTFYINIQGKEKKGFVLQYCKK